MSDVRNGQTSEIVPHDFQLGGGVADRDSKEEEKPVEIGELVGKRYAARGQGRWEPGLWNLVRYEGAQVDEGERPARDYGTCQFEAFSRPESGLTKL